MSYKRSSKEEIALRNSRVSKDMFAMPYDIIKSVNIKELKRRQRINDKKAKEFGMSFKSKIKL